MGESNYLVVEDVKTENGQVTITFTDGQTITVSFKSLKRGPLGGLPNPGDQVVLNRSEAGANVSPYQVPPAASGRSTDGKWWTRGS